MDFQYSSAREATRPAWCYNIRVTDHVARCIRQASRLYERRFGVPAPEPEQRATSNSIKLIFPIVDQPAPPDEDLEQLALF
jgi:hypothetical protein